MTRRSRWRSPRQADNGSAITGYTATCTSSNGGTPGSLSGSASPLVVTGLTNGKTYTCTVLATNGEGNSAPSLPSTATVPATVPGAPAQPTVVHGAAKITVTFAAPVSNGGSVVTGYTASCSSSDGGAAGSNTGTVSPIAVLSLTNGRTYTCTVHASNALGAGAESTASASAVPAAVPDAPAQPAVTRGNTQISVAFVAPASNGSPITGYTAACTSSDGGAFGSHAGGTSPIVVAGLTNGSTYTCTVLATNAEGDSSPSVASAEAVPATLPGAPAQPTVTHSNTSISVAFVAPASNGSPITGYTASCTSSDGGATGSNTGAGSPISVGSLTNGDTYTCTVFATNASGDGPPSVASATTVPATTPGTPVQPTVTHGDAQISVAFAAPANGGSAITGYTASCTSTDGGAAGDNSGATSPIVVASLSNGNTYTCVVHATNAEGNGSDSVPSASTVPAAVPDAPAAPSLTHGNTQISVAFVAPANGGSAITGYTATCTSSDGGASGAQSGPSSPLVVESLTNGSTYTCVVHATNGEGPGPDSIASAPAVPATVPDTPAAPTVTRGDTQISVAFVVPANGGSVITQYVVTCTSSNGGAVGDNTGVSSPISVFSVTNGKTYTCVVHATNAEGDGSDSAASASTIPAAVPDAPAAPTVTHGNAQISVAFVAPGNNGGTAITGYTATCTSSDGGVAGSNPGASSPIIVSGLDNGNTYTCTVHATNAVGDSFESPGSTSTVPATVPDPPVSPIATFGNGQITVGFGAPDSDGGSAITGYTASCTSGVGAPGSNVGSTSPIVVTGLDNGDTYTCTVRATNAEGDSVESTATDATVPATVPGQPARPTIVAVATHISVSFVAPADGGSAITSYTASCVSSDGGVSGSNTGAGSPIAVQSLSKGNTYTCTVHATNVAGDSAESPASLATVVPATVPDAPAAPTTTFGNGLISVAFVAPANGGSAITGFSANCTSSDGGTPGSHSSGTSPIVVTGLDNGHTYTCTVLATNALGDSNASAASAATVPATVPGAPAAPTPTRGNTTISVAFLAPVSDGGSAVTGYTAACVSSDGGAPGSNTGLSSPVVVMSLTNGNTYTCTVFATNVAGAGPASAASAAAVPATVPSVPSAPALTHGNGLISVAVVAPANGGSVITGYTAACTSSNGGTAGGNTAASSPIVVTGLDNGSTYTCTAFASNAVGDSAASAPSASTVPATVPSAPVAPSVVRENSAISVAFVAPASGGSVITGYTASCTSSDGGTAGSNSAATSPILVGTLDDGSTYTCTVHATNAEGSSAESIASATVVPAAVPVAPAQPTVTPGATSISVAFVAPADGGSAISGYTASCVSSNGGVSGSQAGPSSPIVVSGLSKGASYTCTVHATNVVGNSLESPASIATVVPATVPDAASAPTLTHGDASISVAFVAPGNGGSAITSFVATCTSTDGGATGSNSGASSPIVVVTLTNTKTYTCTVHAHNTVGNGAESPASASTMPNVVPGAPARPGVVVGPHRLTVTFGAAPDLGTVVTDYGATCTSSNGGAASHNTGSTSPLVVSSLTNGKVYTCVVHARNAQGPGVDSVASISILVASGPHNTVAPTVTGSALVQRTLTAHKGTWTAAPAPTFHYQWQRCNQAGTSCASVGGRTSGTYRLTNADVDKRLRLVVDATNIVGTVEKASAPTGIVGSVPEAISGPYFYNGVSLVRAGSNIVGTATHGATVWTVTADGNVTGPRFGPHGGTLVGMPLSRPIVGMQATPSGKGYWLFAGDGGVFTFGDARFLGSTGGMHLNSSIVAMEATPSGKGYWLFAGDGGVFTFGDAHFHGSTGSSLLTHPAVAMLATPSGNGYWIVTADGRAFAFGDAASIGGVANLGRTDIVGLISSGNGFRFASKSLQLLVP